MSFEQHMIDLRGVLSRLRSAGLIANAAKCSFVVKRLNLLGYVIEGGLLKPSDEKLSVISGLCKQSLITKKQIKKAGGLINFFREFIPNCEELLVPLVAMLKKNMPDKVEWTTLSEKSLQELKHALLSNTCLIPPMNKCFHLFTDASYRTVNAWLG
jgi:hypothetical protein